MCFKTADGFINLILTGKRGNNDAVKIDLFQNIRLLNHVCSNPLSPSPLVVVDNASNFHMGERLQGAANELGGIGPAKENDSMIAVAVEVIFEFGDDLVTCLTKQLNDL